MREPVMEFIEKHNSTDTILKFYPEKNDWGNIVPIEDIKTIQHIYEGKKYKMICLADRDDLTLEEMEDTNRKLIDMFEKFFPEASEFEIGAENNASI